MKGRATSPRAPENGTPANRFVGKWAGVLSLRTPRHRRCVDLLAAPPPGAPACCRPEVYASGPRAERGAPTGVRLRKVRQRVRPVGLLPAGTACGPGSERDRPAVPEPWRRQVPRSQQQRAGGRWPEVRRRVRSPERRHVAGQKTVNGEYASGPAPSGALRGSSGSCGLGRDFARRSAGSYCPFFGIVGVRAMRNPTKWMPFEGAIMNRLPERAYCTSWFQPPPRKTLNLPVTSPTGSMAGASA